MARFRPRITIRRSMIAVAIVAVLMQSFIWCKHSSIYGRRALLHEESARSRREYEANLRKMAVLLNKEPDQALSLLADQMARDAAHDEAMKIKYDRAARYPWLTVGPDPPEPK